uniref:SRCR domain-containing protein n=1 Tax=Callorhinchus milii TaxID=7868 RepID=A0A4W3HKH7_CALMI
MRCCITAVFILRSCVPTAHRQIRLTGGTTLCSGRLEIVYGNQRGTLCRHYWGLQEANVVCEQLQCGAAVTAEAGAHVGNGSEIIWKSHYECRGNETQLWDCPVGSWDQITCTHEDDVSVTCSSEDGLLRLSNGGSRCDGRVEIYTNGTWGRVLDDGWDLSDANVVCRQLDCGSAIAAYNSSTYGEGGGTVRLNNVQCEGNETRLSTCNVSRPVTPLSVGSDVGVLCSGEVQTTTTTCIDIIPSHAVASGMG